MNAATISIDWEDFGQLFGMYHHNRITEPVPGTIERQTSIMLDMLDEANVKATFFVLGMLAKYKPGLVKKIHSYGHEIALHGMNHKAMFTLSRKEAEKDIVDSYHLVTDIIGERIFGYRAPFFSMNESNLYLLEIIASTGMSYDSSVFPKKMSRYGIEDFSTENKLYDLPDGNQIVELPLTVAEYFRKKWPVAGGGYIRLMPQTLVRKVFNDFRKRDEGAMIYMHPYEFDTSPISVATNYPEGESRSGLKVQTLNLRWNIFRQSVRGKIKMLLKEHQFVTCKQKADYVKKNGISSKLLGRTQ